MLWTVFKLLIVVWMLKIVLDFGGSALQVVLVVSLALLLLGMILRYSSYSSVRPRGSMKTGRFNSPIAEQFAGASKTNSLIHNRIFHHRI